MSDDKVPEALVRALRLDETGAKPLVALVGGGGKTTTMWTLARGLAAQGQRVITTTTTRLCAGQRDESAAWCLVGDEQALEEALDTHGQCLVVSAEGDATHGLSIEQVMALYARDDVDAVIIEADGSRRRPLKAPAPHEPVIPPAATHVVALVGADAFGKPLDEATVHRPDRAATVAQIPLGSPITPEIVARLLAATEGARQYVPSSARFIPFINKVESNNVRRLAYETAAMALAKARVDEVLIGSLRGDAPFAARRSRCAGVVLAAGQATRFGATKQLLDWHGTPLVAVAAQKAAATCEVVIVVTGHESDRVAAAVAPLRVQTLYNSQYRSGQGSSVALAAQALLKAEPFIGEALFMVADQPRLSPELLVALQERRGLKRIAVPRYANRPRNPALFDRALFSQLASLSGDVGGRHLFADHADDIAWVDVEDGIQFADVDTPDDWRFVTHS